MIIFHAFIFINAYEKLLIAACSPSIEFCKERKMADWKGQLGLHMVYVSLLMCNHFTAVGECSKRSVLRPY